MQSKIDNRSYYTKRFRFFYVFAALFILYCIKGIYSLAVYLQNDVLHTPTLVSRVIGSLEGPFFSAVFYYFFLSNKDSKISISIEGRIVSIILGNERTNLNVDHEINFEKSTFKNGLLRIYKNNHTTHFIVPESIVELPVKNFIRENIIDRIKNVNNVK